jgi:hypothetical protein
VECLHGADFTPVPSGLERMVGEKLPLLSLSELQWRLETGPTNDCHNNTRRPTSRTHSSLPRRPSSQTSRAQE